VQLLFYIMSWILLPSMEENKYMDYPTSSSGKGFTVQLLLLYMEMELCYILEEAKYLELSNRFFCVSVRVRNGISFQKNSSE
jgi:hypothetical protein